MGEPDSWRTLATRPLILGWAAVALLGCPEPPVTPNGHSSRQAQGVIPSEPETAGASQCSAPARRGSVERNQAIDALAAGKGREATLGFLKTIQAHPNDHTAQALLVAARKRQDKLSRDVEAGLRASSPIILALPVKADFVAHAVAPRDGAAKVRLTRKASSKNLILDDGDWFEKNGLPRALNGRVSPDDVPDYMPRMFEGSPVDLLFDHQGHLIGRYGSALVVCAQGMKPIGFAAAAPPAPQGHVLFAKMAGSSIVLSLIQSGKSRLASFDAKSGTLQWASDGEVASAQTFELTRDHIVSGDGGSGSRDNIFLIDAATGKILQKEKLGTAATFLVIKGNDVFVRSYDTDYVFGFSAPPEKSVPPAFTPIGPVERAVPEASSCAFEQAIAASDARDLTALATAVSELQSGKADASVIGAFQGVGRFLEQQSRTAALDLTTAVPRVLPAPPWDYQLLDSSRADSASKPRLTKKSSTAGGKPWVLRRGSYEPEKPWLIPPIEKGKLPAGARQDIPSQYGNADLELIIPDGDRLILVYGGRYVAVTKGSKTEAVIDFEAYRHPPKVNPQWKDFAVGDVTYALTDGDTLFVANGGGSYAKEMFGKKGFMSAVSLSTGKLLWRSQPLVAGSGPFAIFQDFLMTGYGFTSEPDNVFLLDKGTGKVATKMAVESAPDGIVLSGSRATVFTYDSTIEFEITISN